MAVLVQNSDDGWFFRLDEIYGEREPPKQCTPHARLNFWKLPRILGNPLHQCIEL